MKLKALIIAIICTLSLFAMAVTSPADAAGALANQQPRVQAPAPDTCEQAMRENSAYRDRIASLERQIDATEESAKTFYLRAATLEDAYRGAMRLADEYRNELAAERDRSYRLERDLRELQARATAPARPRKH